MCVLTKGTVLINLSFDRGASCEPNLCDANLQLIYVVLPTQGRHVMSRCVSRKVCRLFGR